MSKFLRDGVRPQKTFELAKSETSFHEIVDIPKTEKADINMDEIRGEKLSPTRIDTKSPKNQSTEESPLKPSSTSPHKSDSNLPRRKKAKQLRIEKKKAKCEILGKTWEPEQKTSDEKKIRDFVEDVDETNCHKLKVIIILFF